MLRVLVVGKGPPDRGGIAAYLTSLQDSAVADAHELEFLNLTRPGPPRGGRLDLHNVRATVLDAVAVWRASSGCHVVHLHTALAPAVTAVRAGLLTLVARIRGADVVLHAHGGRVLEWMASPLRRWLLRLVLAPATVVAVVASSVEASLRSILDGDRLFHVPNGVDLARFHPRPSGDGDHTPQLLYVGLLTPRKGVLDLFRASEILQERGVRHELALVGGTPDEGPEAEQVVRTAGRSATFAGVKDHAAMPAVYAGADVFCLPSWWEAMPLTILEAMAAGLPVVATDVGDVRELVEDGRSGTVVPPQEPALLADALEPMLRDPELRARYGRAGRKRVEDRFSSEVAFAEVDRLYRRAAGGRR